MKRAWKPGDVAVHTETGERVLRFIPGFRDDPKWVWNGITREGTPFRAAEGFGPLRPLVVIDPEDREQVERFAVIYDEAFERLHPSVFSVAPELGDDADNDLMRAALREFANPTPTIEEPAARLAVVEDRNGDEWCHIGEGVWRSLTSTGAYMVEKHWHDADSPLATSAVRVLSEGVQDS